MTPERLGLLWGITVFSGAGARLISALTGLPGVVLLLLSGLLIGRSGLGLVEPLDLGKGLETIVGLLVSLVLFDGGLNLRFPGGAIKSIVDGSKTRYDGNLDPHFHLKCDKCGFIKDVQARDINLRFQLNEKYDFKASNIEFTINGICNKHK